MPNLVIYQAFSPNDGAPTTSTDKVARLKWLTARAFMRGNNILCLPVNGIPRAASATTSNWTNGQDDIRKTFNSQVVNNLPGMADIASALSSSEQMGAASWFRTGMTSDWIHPNEAGSIVAGEVIKSALNKFL